jgi:hypothetical protein
MVVKRKRLATVDEVIWALGIGRACELARVKGRTSPLMWQARKGFSPRTYAAFTRALKRAGYTADPSLWRQITPEA